LASSILFGVFAWRLYMLAFGIVFRPWLPVARLVQLDDRDAFSLDRRISTVILTLAAVRIVDRLPIAPQASPDAVAAGQVLAGIAGL
jgi:moderate conductance mechanosensitive channel